MLEPDIFALCVLAHDDEVHPRISRLQTWQVLDWAEVREQLELLAQGHVDGFESAAHGCRNRPLNRATGTVYRIVERLRDVLAVLGVSVGTRRMLVPLKPRAAGFQYADDCPGYFRADPVSGNECDIVCAPPLSLRDLCLLQALEFLLEFVYVFEIAIDRCEADERHRVVLLQALHDELADLCRGALAL